MKRAAHFFTRSVASFSVTGITPTRAFRYIPRRSLGVAYVLEPVWCAGGGARAAFPGNFGFQLPHPAQAHPARFPESYSQR